MEMIETTAALMIVLLTTARVTATLLVCVCVCTRILRINSYL